MITLVKDVETRLCVCVYLRGEEGKSSLETVIQIQFVSYDKNHIGED